MDDGKYLRNLKHKNRDINLKVNNMGKDKLYIDIEALLLTFSGGVIKWI